MSYRYNLSQLTIGTSHSSKVTSTKQTLHTDVHTIVFLISIDEDSKAMLSHKQLMATPCQAKQAMTIHQSTSQTESRYDMYIASLKI
jgi:predicted RNA-binding protein with RPS1 domain